jgi:hypothetical protein
MFLIMLQMLSISITLKAFAKLVKKSYEYVNLRTVGIQISHPKAISFFKYGYPQFIHI